MGRARDPTAEPSDLAAAARAWATVSAHLDALCGAGDCGTALTDDVVLTIMETGEVTRGRVAFAAPPAVATLVAGTERAMIEAEFTGRHTGEFAPGVGGLGAERGPPRRGAPGTPPP